MMHATSEQAQRAHAKNLTRISPRNLPVAVEAIEDLQLQVFVVSPQKRPITENGRNDATRDLSVIERCLTRQPDALIAIPTGQESGVIALDVDAGGEASFSALLAELGCPTAEDLSRVWSFTPGSGRHYFFKHRPGSTPRTRASDIAANIDSRALGGSIILPGNVLPDGRSYQQAGSAGLSDLEYAPPSLLYHMTFGARDRALIDATPDLKAALSDAGPECWSFILEQWRAEQAARIASRKLDLDDDEGMRRQALHDLRAIAVEFSALTDGRRHKLFSLACRVARYVHHGFLSETEFRSSLIDAARANGSLAKHGPVWAVSTIRNAINRASRDPLPPLARVFRSQTRAV